jgi:hypothetical protein
MDGACSTNGGKKRTTLINRLLVGKPNGKGPLGRPRSKCVDNIKMALEGWDAGRGVDRSDLAQDRD